MSELLNWPEVMLFLLVVLLAGIAFFVLYFRLMRLEAKLQENRAVALIRESMQGLIEGLERMDLRPIEGYLFEIKELLRRMEKRVAPTFTPEAENQQAMSEGPLQEVVNNRLQRLGFEQIKILTDLRTIATDPCEVQVEAMKEEVTYKGRIMVHGGVVVETRMQPAYEVFP